MTHEYVLTNSTHTLKTALFRLALPFAALLGGCEDEGDEIDSNCQLICDKYVGCHADAGVDNASCKSECVTKANQGTDPEPCEECVEQGSCTDIEGCFANCPVITVVQ